MLLYARFVEWHTARRLRHTIRDAPYAAAFNIARVYMPRVAIEPPATLFFSC